jgi:UDP-3-O-[3-hydroxymyristoyl] glucosamine N-acyltransferase
VPDPRQTESLVHRTACVEGIVGEGTRVGPHAWVGPLARVGRDCVIGAGARIGGDGFGYLPTEDGRWEQKPQTHGVVIEDDVHVGANACVDRGSYRDTRVGRGTRIDNLVHVGHNVQIGEDCLVVALSMLGGSAVLGDHAYVAPAAAVRDHLTVGADALVGLGAVVVRDVSDGEHVKGVPASAFEPSAASLAAKPPGRDLAA